MYGPPGTGKTMFAKVGMSEVIVLVNNMCRMVFMSILSYLWVDEVPYDVK